MQSSNLLPVIAVMIAVSLGHVRMSGRKLSSVGPFQYLLHMFYAVAEPFILRITDFLITNKAMTGNAIGRGVLRLIALMSHYLPHGMILTSSAAGRFLDYIEQVEGPAGARIGVGPCVCQRSLNRWKEPSCKDIVILYGADIYTHLNMGYRIITASEAQSIIRSCHEKGLVHSLDFCMQSGRWTFVICNCDAEICVLTRTYMITGKFIYPGPEIVSLNHAKCRGEEKCGKCIPACIFGVNTSTGAEPDVDFERCTGCGQCVRVCTGKARSMLRRIHYGREPIVPTDILLG